MLAAFFSILISFTLLVALLGLLMSEKWIIGCVLFVMVKIKFLFGCFFEAAKG